MLQRSVKELLPARDPDGHKGSFGKVLLYAGSFDMAGAAVLSATAVLRIGAGMVKLWSDERNRIILQSRIPESLLRSLPADISALKKDLAWADVIAAGCGIGCSTDAAGTLRFLLESPSSDRRIPYVLDADALNLIAKLPELREDLKNLCRKTDCILTPHGGELDRLYRSVCRKRPEELSSAEKARALSDHFHCIMVAKSSHTLVVSPDHDNVFENTAAGNSGMATAGSGDVLTGTIAGLLAQGLDPEDAAIRGVQLHALAGDRAAKIRGEHGLIAGDLLDSLGLEL